jgi:hypothetical protein
MSTLKNGFYVQIKYTDRIKLIFSDLLGNIIYIWDSPIFNYINNITPFAIYMNSDTCEFYNGLLYDITVENTATNLNFKSNFNIS